MLRKCLASLSMQLVDSTVAPTIIVVENDETPSCKELVYEFSDTCPYPVVYVHEPVRGIARARNVAIEAALNSGAEWIAFIDDDEVADQDWLAALMAVEYRHVPVLVGRHETVYTGKLPFWAVVEPKRLKPEHEGRSRKTSTCGNVRFSMNIVRAGIRFNERIGLMGGEDIEYFGRA